MVGIREKNKVGSISKINTKEIKYLNVNKCHHKSIRRKWYYLFTYFWPGWVFIAAQGLSLVAESGSSYLGSVFRLLTAVAPVAENGHEGAQAQEWWCVGLAALQHMGSSWARDLTSVPAWQGGFLPLDHQGSPKMAFFKCVDPIDY